MRTKAQDSRWPKHGEDEHTATTFQLTHDPDHPKDERRFRFDVGDHVVYPLGKAVVTWLDEETGDCLVRPLAGTTHHIEGHRKTLVVTVDGKELTPYASQAVHNHSPDGFNYGYNGSGPAQLALAIMLHAGCPKAVVHHHYQNFKRDVIARLPDDFILDVTFDQDWNWQAKVEMPKDNA